MVVSFYCIPGVTALIGWVTNVVAVKMLFHPRRPISILGWKIQGAIPRRQAKLARSIAVLFEEELVSHQELAGKLTQIDLEGAVAPLLQERVSTFLTRLSDDMPMLKMFLNDSLKGRLTERLQGEIMEALPSLQEKLGERVGQEIDLTQLIEEKVTAFSLPKLEEIVMSVAKKELKTIEVFGGLLGFLIGLGQVGLMIAMG